MRENFPIFPFSQPHKRPTSVSVDSKHAAGENEEKFGKFNCFRLLAFVRSVGGVKLSETKINRDLRDVFDVSVVRFPLSSFAKKSLNEEGASGGVDF